MKALFFFVALLSFAIVYAEPYGNQSQIQATIPGIRKPVSLVLPSGFRPALTDVEELERSKLIRALQASPSGKLIITDVYLTHWESTTALPILCVGALPSAVKAQGQFKASYWKEVSSLTAKQARAQLPIIEHQLAQIGHAGAYSALNRILLSGDAKSSVILSFYPAAGHDSPPMLLARKLRYVRQAIVLFEIAIDASKPRAVEMLERYVKQIDVKE